MNPTARVLGYLGLIPFFAAALGHVLGAPTAALGLAYGAVILSFLGGIHWGAALLAPQEGTARRYVASVVPSLIGWMALWMPMPFAVFVLLGGFLGQWLYDRQAMVLWPDDFLKLRTHLTIGASSGLGLLIF